MKYEIEVEGQQLVVELQCESERGTATINGNPVEFEVSEPEPGVYTLIFGNSVLEARAIGDPTQGSFEAIVGHNRIPLRIIDPRRRRRGGFTVTGKIELSATMPGRVVRWLCQPGDPVTEGQGVVVLEAMKMQNEVRSPKAGRVREFRITPGQTVEGGTVLAVIE
ncbi:MAG: biotin/lipoyl-binding protein [Acidobacteria bacterium]|nr:biotin/lipoyl-binding protein [Acidobacteriota bacterium]